MKNICIIGGGIAGLAIAHKLSLRYPKTKIVLFEKEKELGVHQSGRNSGVLHCGLYYKPGSLKAKLAVNGIRQMTNFCQTHHVPYEICGKVVVASDDREATFLDSLMKRGSANGLSGLKYLTADELKQREPFVRAKKSLLVPEEGIVDYKAVMQKLKQLIEERGGKIILNTQIQSIKSPSEQISILSDGKNEWEFDLVVCCGGLHSDQLYQKLTGEKRPLRIVPFRGKYLMLKPEAEKLVNHLIYPVPDPEYPFLGVHFTRTINGHKEVGPNAVFAMKREGYTNKDISFTDLADSLGYKGFWSFLGKNFSFSMGEFYSSISTSAFLKKAQKMVPEITTDDFTKNGTAGVRAQAMDANGKLLMDFNVIKKGNQIHVLNAPSPGATASLEIADYILSEYLS